MLIAMTLRVVLIFLCLYMHIWKWKETNEIRIAIPTTVKQRMSKTLPKKVKSHRRKYGKRRYPYYNLAILTTCLLLSGDVECNPGPGPTSREQVTKRPGEIPSLQPPQKQLKSGDICILCSKFCDEQQKNLNAEQWKAFRSTAEKWEGLDTFGNVFKDTDWGSGPVGKRWHKSCKLNFAGERKLQQALKRKANSADEPSSGSSDEKENVDINQDERPATRKSVGVIHEKSSCIWCMKGMDNRHPDRTEKLSLIENRSTWQKIVLSVPFIPDKAIRVRMEMMINSTSEPLAAKMSYHKKCYTKYVTKGLKECERVNDGDENLENVIKTCLNLSIPRRKPSRLQLLGLLQVC